MSRSLRVLVIDHGYVSLMSVDQMKRVTQSSSSSLNPGFKIVDDEWGIVLDYPKEDQEEPGSRSWSPQPIGTPGRHPERTDVHILVFNPSNDHQLQEALRWAKEVAVRRIAAALDNKN